MTDISPAEATAMLDWLVAMGADEVISETPINRFDTQPAAVQPAPSSSPAPGLVPKVPRAVAAEAVSGEDDGQALAAACTTIDGLDQAVATFGGCSLRKSALHTCFVDGNLASSILILADRARTEEDKSGQVFGGKNAVLLENMLRAIQLAPADVMMANFVPWRPPGNRAPTEVEVRQCAPFVTRLVELAKPKVILAFGGLPGQILASGVQPIAKQRGQWLDAGGVPLISTFHPDDLLKTPNLKKLAWRDLLLLRDRLNEIQS